MQEVARLDLQSDTAGAGISTGEGTQHVCQYHWDPPCPAADKEQDPSSELADKKRLRKFEKFSRLLSPENRQKHFKEIIRRSTFFYFG